MRFFKAVRWFLPRILVSLVMLGLMLGLAEFAFSRYTVSDGLAYTRMHHRWVEKYWQPINTLGYRDYEWSEETLRGKTRILVVGDSFAAGHGVNQMDDRFANVLQSELGDSYAVMVAAQPGWDTDKELQGLLGYPTEPNVLILSYFINDIVPACKIALGTDPYLALTNLPPPESIADLVNESDLANYLYWSVYARNRMSQSTSAWLDAINTCYEDDRSWGYHSGELQAFYNWARVRGIPLVVVIFPHLGNLDLFTHAILRVDELFRFQEVAVINERQAWRSYPASERVVNGLDWHPSLRIHAEVGNRLAELLTSQTPPTMPATYTLEDLLTKPTYQDYQAANRQFVPAEAEIFMAGTDDLDFYFYATLAANLSAYNPSVSPDDRTAIFDLLSLADHLTTERELTPEQTQILTNWRTSKAASDLTEMGFDYLLVSERWLGWLSDEEFATLERDYITIRRWELPDYRVAYWLYQVRE